MTRKVNTLQPVGASGDVQSPMLVDLDGFALPPAKYRAVNLAGPQTFGAGDITGAQLCAFFNSNAAPGTFTTRTAAQMIADTYASIVGAESGLTSWVVRIINSGAGAFTVAGGTGVTVSGTATIAQNTYRDFVCTVSPAGAITMQSAGTGTHS